MAKARVKKNTKKNGYDRKAHAVAFRFLDEHHDELVRRAVKHSGLTLNGWIVQATLDRARRDLGLE
jgi:uncharacterized protein (DUF1778 family)